MELFNCSKIRKLPQITASCLSFLWVPLGLSGLTIKLRNVVLTARLPCTLTSWASGFHLHLPGSPRHLQDFPLATLGLVSAPPHVPLSHLTGATTSLLDFSGSLRSWPQTVTLFSACIVPCASLICRDLLSWVSCFLIHSLISLWSQTIPRPPTLPAHQLALLFLL